MSEPPDRLPDRPVLLASRSPRRADLLRAAGIGFQPIEVDVDETVRAGEAPEAYVRRLAIAKAEAGARSHSGRVVLGADTTVVVDGAILGKPADAADASAMLHRLGDRSHLVMTGLAVSGPAGTRAGVATTRVTFRPLSAQDITRYVVSGEPMDKAGGYAIQGGAARFVTEVDGSYTNVVGLPIALVCRLLMGYPDGKFL